MKETIFLSPGEDMRRWYRDPERDAHSHPYSPQPFDMVVELWYDDGGQLGEMRCTPRSEWLDPDPSTM